MTYEKPFVAIRHESEITTPLVNSPMINFSLREMAYLGIFGLSAVFAAVGTVSFTFAIATIPFLILALFKWHGEIPEMYIYYIAMSIFEPSAKKKRKSKSKRMPSSIKGFGNVFESQESKMVPEVIQKVKFSNDSIPINMTLDIGNSHKFENVTILIDKVKIARDETTGSGHITITIMPQKGIKNFTVQNKSGNTIIAKTVEFIHD